MTEKQFLKNIRKYMRSEKVTYQSVADAMGLNYSTVFRTLNPQDKRHIAMTMRFYLRLCLLLEVSPDYFLYGGMEEEFLEDDDFSFNL